MKKKTFEEVLKEKLIKKGTSPKWLDKHLVVVDTRKETKEEAEVNEDTFEEEDWLTNYNNATEHEIYGVNPLDYEK